MRKNYANLEGTILESRTEQAVPQKWGTVKKSIEPEERTWKFYERMLAEGKRAQGYRYYPGNVNKESSAVKSLMREFTPSQMEGVIRFLLSDAQTFTPPEYVGLHLLMGAWKNTVIPAAITWMEKGEMPKKRAEKNDMPREFKSNAGKGITIS